jgi:DNA polymerase III delta prime subunit
VYFGYPQAHEDDAEQAVHAGLALLDAIPALQAGFDTKLQVCIGIATGMVVIGDVLTTEAGVREHAVVGDTPNLAARLQTMARPGSSVVCTNTRRLTDGYFEYRDLGASTLKGWSEPIYVWQVLRSTGVKNRFEAQHQTKLMPPLGRDEEIEFLLRRWRTVKRGEGRAVLLTGEPGIGKTTLIGALRQRLEAGDWRLAPSPQAPSLKPLASPVSFAQGQCIEHYGAGEAYLPILEALGRLCRETDGERLIDMLKQHAPTWLVQMPALLNRRERGDGDDDGSASDAWADEAPVLAGLGAASVQGIVALGPQRGARLRRLGDAREEGEPSEQRGCHARANGFDLHAGLVVPAGQRDRLERVCRYALRPPVTQERIHLTEEGQVRLQLRQPWRDGTTDVVFDPVEFLGRLAVLVPRPRINLILYHGVLGPRAAWRSEVVPCPASDDGRDVGKESAA